MAEQSLTSTERDLGVGKSVGCTAWPRGVDWPWPLGKPWGFIGKSRGLGDWVAGAIKFVTFGRIKPCGGCRRRQAALNRWWRRWQATWNKWRRRWQAALNRLWPYR